MKKTFLLILFLTNLLSAQSVIYVSEVGLAQNDGTKEHPKNIETVFKNITSNTTYIFKKGTYNTSILPKIINLENIKFISEEQYGAKIIFERKNRNREKIEIVNSNYITISGFILTQDTQGESNIQDAIIKIFGSNNCKIIDNKIHNAGDDGIKLSQHTTNSTIERNHIYDVKSNAIDVFNCENNKIIENYIYNCKEAILVKGGSRDIEVYNNYILSSNDGIVEKGISLGGTSQVGKDQIWDYREGLGYEAYNCIAYNNILVGKGDNDFEHGALRAIGSYKCGYFNNTIVGAIKGFKTYRALEFYTIGNEGSQWNWEPTVFKPIFKNNIIYKCEIGVDLNSLSHGWRHSYNCFYEIKEPNTVPQAEGNKYENPNFVNEDGDWHLQSSSLYNTENYKGIAIENFEGYLNPWLEDYKINKLISIVKDKESVNRNENNFWKMGAYQNSNDNPIKISASDYTDLNKDNSTIWSANEKGEWIQFYLNKKPILTDLKLAFLLGDTRTYKIKVYGSTKGTEWKLLYDDITSQTSNLQHITIPKKHYRYLRIYGYGNNSNNAPTYTHITNFEIANNPLVNISKTENQNINKFVEKTSDSYNISENKIYFHNFETIEYIDIYDYSGKLIDSFKNVNTPIDINHLNTGAYILKILYNNGVKLTERIYI